MKKAIFRFSIALIIAIIGGYLFAKLSLSLNLGAQKFSDYVLYPLGALALSLIFFHDKFPTNKRCPICKKKLKGLLTSKIKDFYDEAIKKIEKKTLNKCFYVCPSCKNLYSFRLKLLGNLKNK